LINKEEILVRAEEFAIHTSNVQRDYVFGWFLAGIYSECQLRDYFVLKGGNCLRKAYFKDTRFSNDLDFSLRSDLGEGYIKEQLNLVCNFVTANTGIIFDKGKSRVEQKKRIDADLKVYDARIYFRDFFGKESEMLISIRLDISRFDKIYLPIQNRNIIHPYSDYGKCSRAIYCIKLEELLAAKLKCLLQRRHVADLYDYVFSIVFGTGLEINRLEIVSTLLKMTIFEKSPGVLKNLFIGLPFEFFKRLWRKHIICPKLGVIEFETAVDKFVDHVSGLFGKLSTGRGEDSFFPAKYRNIILEAGSGMYLMEVVYDGFKRIVEPYSLAYKTRKDGISNEYFFVWDRTGGTSGPGIKAFLHPKIEDIKLLTETFEPRYQVELSKAGETAKSSYFGKPFARSEHRSSRATREPQRARVSYISGGPKYLIECSVCGKRFTRKSRGVSLSRHKDKYGNDCFGRSGFLLNIKY